MQRQKKKPPNPPAIVRRDILALSLIAGLGQASIRHLVESGLTIDNLATLDENELRRYVKGSGNKAAIAELKSNFETYRERAEESILNWSDSGISVITSWDSAYPASFSILPDPPSFLYCKGNLSLLNKKESVAIVGTRESSQLGESVASKTAAFFAEKGFNVVSGLAKGIDTAAHQGTLRSNGETTAVLVDVGKIYPPENSQLADDILKKSGLLIAENPPNSITYKGAFVQRDRLQSALSAAIFPIETEIQGGTMHTVRFAREQRRLIFCPNLTQWDGTERFGKVGGIKKLLVEEWAQPFVLESLEEVLIQVNSKISIGDPSKLSGDQFELPI